MYSETLKMIVLKVIWLKENFISSKNVYGPSIVKITELLENYLDRKSLKDNLYR